MPIDRFGADCKKSCNFCNRSNDSIRQRKCMVLTDEHLIERTLAGSQAAFGQLLARYQDFVFSLCLRVLRRREEAEEAAQDAFVKVYHSLHTFKEQSRFSTWLYTLTYRTALDFARKKRLPIASIDDEEGAPQLAADLSSSADQALNQNQLHDQLESLIGQLSESEGMVIKLFYLQEQSVKEIVKITGLTETNVKTKLFRGREALRKKMTKQHRIEMQQYL